MKRGIKDNKQGTLHFFFDYTKSKHEEMRTFTVALTNVMNEQETNYHVPVLLMPSVDGLNIRPEGIYADMTFGGGGHSREILSRLGEKGRLLGFDQDADAEQNIVDDRRFTFVRSNFRYLHNFLRYHGVEQLDGVLADLGVSSHHFDDTERGFSFRSEGLLDMRMNQRAGKTAADVVNTYSEAQLADIFYLYGELKNSRKLASAIQKARFHRGIHTIPEFLEVIAPFFGREREKKDLARVFQALRIEVNGEMEALKEMLTAATEALRPGGRLVVITYHSLEDRMVKNLMKTGNTEGRQEKDFFGNLQSPLRVVNSKVMVPDEIEIERNPRSRSAKLRIAEKTDYTPTNDDR
jgi:16S rRNA (cytosine1402-N4)-methyltransferase